jgi:hypothetical protein
MIDPYPYQKHPPQCACDYCWNHLPRPTFPIIPVAKVIP